MPTYKAKDIEGTLEAFQWNPDDLESAGRLTMWLSLKSVDFMVMRGKSLLIHGVTGDVTASPGDYVIEHNEFKRGFFCSEALLFEMLFELVG